MIHLKKRLAFALLTGAAALPCLAESSVASSASDSLSQSSTAISDSISGSSHSSSPDNKQVKGDFKVIDMAELADRPGMVQLQLRPVAATSDETDILLTLPHVAAANGCCTSRRTRPSRRCNARTASSSPAASRTRRYSSRSPTTGSAT